MRETKILVAMAALAVVCMLTASPAQVSAQKSNATSGPGTFGTSGGGMGAPAVNPGASGVPASGKIGPGQWQSNVPKTKTDNACPPAQSSKDSKDSKDSSKKVLMTIPPTWDTWDNDMKAKYITDNVKDPADQIKVAEAEGVHKLLLNPATWGWPK